MDPALNPPEFSCAWPHSQPPGSGLQWLSMWLSVVVPAEMSITAQVRSDSPQCLHHNPRGRVPEDHTEDQNTKEILAGEDAATGKYYRLLGQMRVGGEAKTPGKSSEGAS